MRIANRDSAFHVRAKHIFTGSNMYSEYKGNTYVVYSYGEHFPMYINKNETWFGNRDRYSSSTSRHQRQANPGNIEEWLDTKEMLALL